MAETTQTTTNTEDSGSDTIRKIVAAIVGIIIIILLVLLAKWVGDQIRERFLNRPGTNTTVQVIPPELSPTPEAGSTTAKTATFSAIPATGPNDGIYLVFAFLALSGASTLLLAKKYTV